MQKIAIIGRTDKSLAGFNIMKFNEDFRTIISSYDLIPLAVIPKSNEDFTYGDFHDFDKDALIEVLKLCDGIIMQGGEDYCSYELFAIDYAYKNDIPILGICLGMQAMGCYLSGNKEIEIGNNNHRQLTEYVHNITIKDNTLLKEIIGQSEILVNSRHNYQVKDIDEKYISAKSPDDIVEAIEDKNKRFFVGVQWHPENLKDDNTKKIFDRFVEEVRK